MKQKDVDGDVVILPKREFIIGRVHQNTANNNDIIKENALSSLKEHDLESFKELLLSQSQRKSLKTAKDANLIDDRYVSKAEQ